MNRRLIINVHPQDHDEAKVSIENVRTKQHREQLEPVDWICALMTLVAGVTEVLEQLRDGSIAYEWRLNPKELPVCVDGEGEEDGEDEDGCQVDENLKWSNRQPTTDFDHFEVSLDLVAVVVG